MKFFSKLFSFFSSKKPRHEVLLSDALNNNYDCKYHPQSLKLVCKKGDTLSPDLMIVVNLKNNSINTTVYNRKKMEQVKSKRVDLTDNQIRSVLSNPSVIFPDNKIVSWERKKIELQEIPSKILRN